ncbi:MAG: hypothetical protein MUF80_07805 [Burkholderiales bacterium]|jgi:hypothetical protein|nr:hypothetical protein [Burkholderiales bacterium]
MSRICDVCGESKPDGAFRKFGRGRKKTCEACESGLAASDGAVGDPPPVAELTLAVERGHGFRARAQDGQLIVEQDADDGCAIVVLSKTEAKVLFAQFAGWCK